MVGRQVGAKKKAHPASSKPRKPNQEAAGKQQEQSTGSGKGGQHHSTGRGSNKGRPQSAPLPVGNATAANPSAKLKQGKRQEHHPSPLPPQPDSRSNGLPLCSPTHGCKPKALSGSAKANPTYGGAPIVGGACASDPSHRIPEKVAR